MSMKGSLLLIRQMEEVLIRKSVEKCMKDTGLMINHKAKGNKLQLMDLSMKENFHKEPKMATAFINGQMALFTKVSGKTMNLMVKEIILGMIKGATLASGKRI